MRIFIIGATGYIGSVISEKLLAGGHTVIGLARSDDAEANLHQRGIAAHRGDLSSAASLVSGVESADAVIYVAASRERDAAQWERNSISALLTAMKDTQKTLIYTSGTSVVGATGDQIVDETYPVNPHHFRGQIEAMILAYAQQGVRAIIIRPSFVYGHGQGILPRYITYAREQGVAGYVLPGDNHWPFVHVDDLADLYILALEKAKTGAIYNAVAGDTLPMRDLSQAIAAFTGAKLTAWTPEEAALIIGRIAHTLAINLRVSGQKAIRELGWQTSSPEVYDEIKRLLS